MGQYSNNAATYADLESIPPHLVAEIVDGVLVTRPIGVPLESMVRTALAVTLGRACKDDSEPESSLVLSNIELHFGAQIVVPDIASWKRSIISRHADASHLDVAPDWVCELVSSHRSDETVSAKRRIYAAAGVPYLWSVDPCKHVLEAFVLQDGAWSLLGRFGRYDTVSAPPFNELKFPLADLWPLDRENIH